jgi:hypothetical protein
MRKTKGRQSRSTAGVVTVEAGANFFERARVTVRATVPEDSDALAVSLHRLGLDRSNSVKSQNAEIILRRSELAGLAALFTELANKVCERDMAFLGGKGNGSRAATFLERNPGWLRRQVQRSA